MVQGHQVGKIRAITVGARWELRSFCSSPPNVAYEKTAPESPADPYAAYHPYQFHGILKSPPFRTRPRDLLHDAVVERKGWRECLYSSPQHLA